jgi:hypothetical protein
MVASATSAANAAGTQLRHRTRARHIVIIFLKLFMSHFPFSFEIVFN